MYQSGETGSGSGRNQQNAGAMNHGARAQPRPRQPIELLQLDFVFAQPRLLTAEDFVRASRIRGVTLTIRALAWLAESGALTPMLVVHRDVAAITQAAAQGDVFLLELLAGGPSSSLGELRAAAAAARVSSGPDMVGRPIRVIDQVAGRRFNRHVSLYSVHQLMALRWLRDVVSDVPLDTVGFVPSWLAEAKDRNASAVRSVVALSALERHSYTRIFERFSADLFDYPGLRSWVRSASVRSTVEWLGSDARQLRAAGDGLLRSASSFDPLAKWTELLREMDRRRWEDLGGDGRSALDYRVAAEVLHLAADDIDGGTEEPRPRSLARLRRAGGLDETLLRFGISPHPSLLLIVEGATERLLFPRLMRAVGIRTDPDFITVLSMDGVDRDLSTLIAFAAGPRARFQAGDAHATPTRPLTRVLVVTDAEGRMASPKDRVAQRERWVDRLVREMPRPTRTPEARQALTQLLCVDTWRRTGGNFEMVHFTDLQIGRAMASIDSGPRASDARVWQSRVAEARAQGRSLKTMMGRRSKTALADALWPTLLHKLRRAEASGTETNIPMVRVLDRATDLARELGRAGVVIPIGARPEAQG